MTETHLLGYAVLVFLESTFTPDESVLGVRDESDQDATDDDPHPCHVETEVPVLGEIKHPSFNK